MSMERLQAALRKAKSPLALGIAPTIAEVAAPLKKQFEEMLGSGHLADCGGRAILLDDSKQNRAYIAKAWGRVIVMDTRGSIIE